MRRYLFLTSCLLVLTALGVRAQTGATRKLSGVVLTRQNELVPKASIVVSSTSGEVGTESDAEGYFEITVPREPVSIRVSGTDIALATKVISKDGASENIQITVAYVLPSIHENVVIEASTLEPTAEQRNDDAYKNTLFSRDDQLFQTLNAGINAGQHEGGGKSLEIRRFGFNLDHGGVNGGLKVLVDDIQQNQGTQGHGQGYLGQLKSLTPELVQDVYVLNGPFSAQYGDFSGLGVVHIRLKESLPDQITLRLQGGSFGTVRSFLAISPKLPNADAFIAYERSRTDGPFLSPLQYKRDNVTGNYTWHLPSDQAISVKLNFGRNDFYSSGQIPLDEVAAGRLERFGFIDPFSGGHVRNGVLGLYYRKQWKSGRTFKADGFLGRSLFDLYSNFTFFLNDQINGDEIQQHDSRMQEGANVQYLHPYKLFGRQALLTVGANYHNNQINVGLNKTIRRNPFEIVSSAHARVRNEAGYVQNSVDFIQGRLHIETAIRFDSFRFDVVDKVDPAHSGEQRASVLQPKFTVAYTPSAKIPTTFYLNYGRGVSSQDARGVTQKPLSPKVSTTDFYQLGLAHNLKRFSLSANLFLIDRSNEQVYIPDDGSFEFKSPSRSYGYEGKFSMRLLRYLAFSGSLTQVTNAFYRGSSPRLYIDSAPHTVANGTLSLTSFHGYTGSLGYRHAGSYRLDGLDSSIRATGLDVLDLNVTKRIRPWIDLNVSVDNLTNKRYYETQNYFESRLGPGEPAVNRVHGTPGYPIGITAGLTLHFFGK